MNNPALVSVRQSCPELADQVPSLRFSHRPGTYSVQDVAERLAVEQLHREKNHIRVAVQFVNVHYVSMRQDLGAVELKAQVRNSLRRAIASSVQYLQPHKLRL
ncbi:MAG: hypothetical protein ABSD02_22590, partial [Steroidobacteraceae bacterium]